MALYLKAKKVDFTSGSQFVALMNEREAWHNSIRAGDKIQVVWHHYRANIVINLSRRRIDGGEIGFCSEFWKHYSMERDETVEVNHLDRPESIKAITKKLLGKSLNYQEFDSIIKDIVAGRIGNTEIAYFVASSFNKDYDNKELYYLTKAIANNGDQLKIKGKAVDKHSVGGIPGNRTTLVGVPIVSCFDVQMPKTSSRAITSPAGSADTMEVLSAVSFNPNEIEKMVKQNNGCIVWGGGLNIAPADDKIIKVSYPISLEPYTKMIVSIMAKKVATGIKYLVIDMPVGKTAKIHSLKTADRLVKKFKYLGRKFKIKTEVVITKANEPVGSGIGPSLEARDVLRVLQQKNNRPRDLEKKSCLLAGKTLELAGVVRQGKGEGEARNKLINGEAWRKMQDIIASQGGNPKIDSEEVTLGAIKSYIGAKHGGRISKIDNKRISDICRILGAPEEKLAGIYLNKKLGERVKKNDRLYTIYAQNEERLKLALAAINKLSIYSLIK